MAIVLAIGLSLAALAMFASRQPWWHVTESSLGVMSERWVAEHRADESRHRST